MAWTSKVRRAGSEGKQCPYPSPAARHAVNSPLCPSKTRLARSSPWPARSAWGVLALHRGETISAAWLVLAAVGTYLIGYRFYSRFLADRVFDLNDRRATPAERLANGRDFVPTTRWVLFGHHFAAIAGAGPLVGPVLAAQFGYLPGTIWIVFGVVLGGRGAGLRDPLRLHAARRQVARPDGPGGDRPAHRHCSPWSRCSPSWSSCSPCWRWSWSTR